MTLLMIASTFNTSAQVINTLFFKFPQWSEELEELAKTNYPAKVVVGYYYLEGKGINKDVQKAVIWFKDAISKPHDDIGRAYGNLAYCDEYGLGVDQDPVKAYEYYLLGATNNDNNSYCYLAQCYEFGQGTDKNLDEALKWYDKCIKNGTPAGRRMSQVRSGYILAFEKGEMQQGMQFLETAGENGSAAAYYFLGDIYNQGIGNIAIDYTKALSYFKKSINTDQILPDVLTIIADFYYEGKGTAQNKDKAKELYQKASERGDSNATRKLQELSF
jgi:hypothetical protein